VKIDPVEVVSLLEGHLDEQEYHLIAQVDQSNWEF